MRTWMLPAGRAELGRQGWEEGLHDGELQRRQQQHPATDVGPRQPDLPLRRAGSLPKGHGRALRCVEFIPTAIYSTLLHAFSPNKIL